MMKIHLLVFALFNIIMNVISDDGYSYPSPTPQHIEPVIQKHIYVHVPPPDPEFHAPPQRVVPPPPPKKHYKIVFIKAPTYAPPSAPIIPELQHHEEKTLIYVLHKNPQDAPPIIIPSPKPTLPSKPEVYFIRYKTQKEINHADQGYLPSRIVVSSTPRPSILAHSGLVTTIRPTLHRITPVNILQRSPTPKYVTPSPRPHSD